MKTDIDHSKHNSYAELKQSVKENGSPAAVAAGRKGGLKGGPARAEALSSSEREAIARKGANARWGK